QAAPPEQLAVRIPRGAPAVAEPAPAGIAVARDPEVAAHVGAHAVGAALDAVHHEVAEELLVRHLVVGAQVEDVHVALAALMRVARAAAGADDVELLVVGREAEPVRIRDLALADYEIDAAARVDAIDVIRKLALERADLRRLAEALLEDPAGIGEPSGRIDGALVELAAVRRIGEPIAAVRMRDDVVRRVEVLAVVLVRDDRHRAVVLVTDDAPGQVLARELAALEVERVAVAVVRRSTEHGDATVVLEPAELPVVRDVAPHEVPALRAPRGALRPEGAGPESQDRRVALAQTVERRVDGEDV